MMRPSFREEKHICNMERQILRGPNYVACIRPNKSSVNQRNIQESTPTQKATSPTVIGHVLSRLKNLGITKGFGVAGDFAFPIEDAIVGFPGIDWVGCCNELNASYAADGYARIHGVAAVCTTYGVGELSAINGIAGAYVEHVPVFHLVGMPKLPTQAARRLVHHTLGNGEFDFFRKM